MKVVLCNAPPGEAEALARQLVEEKLVACVNLMPVRSVFRWKGSVQMEEEVTLVIKVSSDGASALRERIRELHSYELPEIVALDVDRAASLPAYLDWVRAECQSKAG